MQDCTISLMRLINILCSNTWLSYNSFKGYNWVLFSRNGTDPNSPAYHNFCLFASFRTFIFLPKSFLQTTTDESSTYLQLPQLLQFFPHVDLEVNHLPRFIWSLHWIYHLLSPIVFNHNKHFSWGRRPRIFQELPNSWTLHLNHLPVIHRGLHCHLFWQNIQDPFFNQQASTEESPSIVFLEGLRKTQVRVFLSVNCTSKETKITIVQMNILAFIHN